MHVFLHGTRAEKFAPIFEKSEAGPSFHNITIEQSKVLHNKIIPYHETYNKNCDYDFHIPSYFGC